MFNFKKLEVWRGAIEFADLACPITRENSLQRSPLYFPE